MSTEAEPDAKMLELIEESTKRFQPLEQLLMSWARHIQEYRESLCDDRQK